MFLEKMRTSFMSLVASLLGSLGLVMITLCGGEIVDREGAALLGFTLYSYLNWTHFTGLFGLLGFRVDTIMHCRVNSRYKMMRALHEGEYKVQKIQNTDK